MDYSIKRTFMHMLEVLDVFGKDIDEQAPWESSSYGCLLSNANVLKNHQEVNGSRFVVYQGLCT